MPRPGPRALLAYDPADEAHPAPAGQPYQDSAAVLPYAEHNGRTYVLLARRASWLSHPGTWGVFMGAVEATDLDATGRRSFARAAEHELYEESVSIYHRTDANALRACPTHLLQFPSGVRSRTFFTRQAYLPEQVFNEGFAYAVQHNLPIAFRKNDQFRWVLLDDLLACTGPAASLRDAAGSRHGMNLFPVFHQVLSSPAYQDMLRNLP